jgi:hypothetical protein
MPSSYQIATTLGFGRACIGSGKELRLKPLSMPPPIFVPHIVGQPLAGAELPFVS